VSSADLLSQHNQSESLLDLRCFLSSFAHTSTLAVTRVHQMLQYFDRVINAVVNTDIFWLRARVSFIRQCKQADVVDLCADESSLCHVEFIQSTIEQQNSSLQLVFSESYVEPLTSCQNSLF
jgi:hypothetical protein